MAESFLQPQFDTLSEQQRADWLGMWLLLATEILLFGALFLLYTSYRWWCGPAFSASARLHDLTAGVVATCLLLTSSLLVALAVDAARTDRHRRLAAYLAGAVSLGLAFLVLEAGEWQTAIRAHRLPGIDWGITGPESRPLALAFVCYYLMTGLHGLHVLVGCVLLSSVAVLGYRGRFPSRHATAVELVGLYWHFVDVVWVFLFPAFYLIGRT